MRAVLYARYSSDQQREASLEDQLRLCRERITAEGWHLVQVFQDRALRRRPTIPESDWIDVWAARFWGSGAVG